jgi:phytol kinase
MVDQAIMLIERIFRFFFIDNFPYPRLILWLLPICLAWVALSLSAGAWLQERFEWKVAYTRKLFHFLIFGAAACLQWLKGVPGVFILGWAVTAVLVFLLIRGKAHPWYDVLARPADAPHESRYIIYPYLATFTGGVLSNLIFPPAAATAGYLIAGLGDAIGEPVGARWGKHRYKVPSYGTGKPHYRSCEGSMAVWVACIVAFSISVLLNHWDWRPFLVILAATVATLVEAFSPHGWDNLSSQLAGTWLAYMWLM